VPMNFESSSPLEPENKPLLLVLSGLSGAGKDVVLSRLREVHCPVEFIVTVTTRARRPNEQDGVHYHFVSGERFHQMIDDGELLEWANVYGNWYGVPKEPVKQALERGKDVLIKIDVQGAATIKKAVPQAVLIFLATPSMEELGQRLWQRRTESRPDVELRLKTAAGELQQLAMFDYIIINRKGEIERAVEDIRAIITAEKCRVKQREVSL
jgi:guanylate kinase